MPGKLRTYHWSLLSGLLLVAAIVTFLRAPSLRGAEENAGTSRSKARYRYQAYQPSSGPSYRTQWEKIRQVSGNEPADSSTKAPQNKDRTRQGRPPARRNWFSRSKTAERHEPPFDPTAVNVRLQFYNYDWATILQQVARDSNSVLVMDKVPPGRFSKYDRRKYTRKEAVQLLNHELESKDFRLVEKGKFLDVLYLRSARARYHRPELPHYSSRQTQTQPKEPRRFQRYERGVHAISRRSTSRPMPTSTALRNAPFPQDESHTPRNASRHQQTSAVQQFPKRKPILRDVQPQNRKAVEIARSIYKSLQSRSELVDDGPSGFPGFRVYRQERNQPARLGSANASDGPQQPIFTVGIDTSGNKLVVEAAPDQNGEVIQLITHLDKARLGQDETLKIVPTKGDPALIAKAIQPEIAFLYQAAQKQPMAKQPAKKEPMGKKEGPGVIRSIRGQVTIRFVQGVGLVVTGNQEDVDAIMAIIRELDKQAEFTTANVHVQLLRHVNSQALAELLTAVYQQLATVRTGQQQQVGTVSFIPVVMPNAILVVSTPADLKPVLKLIEDLDRPVDPKKEYRVVHLKYAVASQVVANLDALFQQQAAGQAQGQTTTLRGLATRVRTIADIRTNAIIIEAAPNDMQTVLRLIAKLDNEKIPSVNQVRIFRLKNAVATELATLISTSIQSVLNPATVSGQQGAGVGTGAGAQQLRDPKAAVLEFMIAQGDRKRLVRSGILSDIRVTADPRINALVVTAPELSMELMEQLITQLDQPSALVAEIKVFALANGDATAMVNLLTQLFPSQQSTGAQQGQLGIQVASADDASSGLIPLRFTVDPRTNSVIAVGGAEALRVVEAVIFRLDESDVRQRQTVVIKLRNSPVTEVSNAINQFLQSQRDLAQIDPNLVTNMDLLEREIIVVPEIVSNSLLISATPRYFDEIKRIVDNLDQAPPQVVIQALLVEVELNNTDEFGIELGLQDDILFDRGIISNIQTLTQTTTLPTGAQTTNQTILSQESTPGFNFNNQPLGGNTGAASLPQRIGTQGLSNFSLGRVNADLGFGGLVVSAQSSEISVLLRALSAKRTVHVLSRPQITTLDNQLAQIQVGQQVPIVDGVNVTTVGSAQPLIRQDNAGIILTVTPRIRPDNTIVMETVAEKSAFRGQGVPIFTDATNGNTIESPIKTISTARTTVAVPNGQTIVLGGMITKNDDTIQRKVPWLGDIPYLQYLFRYDSTTTVRTELLIFLTPRIVKDDADAEIIKQIESERLHFIEEDAERMHGPLFAAPPNGAKMPAPVSAQPSGSARKSAPGSNGGHESEITQAGYQSSVTGVPERTRRSFLQTSRRTQTQPNAYQPKKKKKSWLRLPWKGSK